MKVFGEPRSSFEHVLGGTSLLNLPPVMESGYTYTYDRNEGGKLHIHTLLIESPKLSAIADRQILLKLDNLQPGGSFKIRGIGHYVQQSKAEGKLSAGKPYALERQSLGVVCTAN